MADRFRIERKFKRDREETCGKEKHNSQIAERRDKEADEITEDTHTHTHTSIACDRWHNRPKVFNG